MRIIRVFSISIFLLVATFIIQGMTQYALKPLLFSFLQVLFVAEILTIIFAFVVGKWLKINFYWQLPKFQNYHEYTVFVLPVLLVAAISTISIMTMPTISIWQWLEGILLVLSAAVAEELILRGVVLNLFVKLFSGTTKYAEVYMCIATSIVFSSAHLMNLVHQSLFQTLDQMIGVFGLGMVLGMLYIRSGSLILPILLHSFFNLPGVVKGNLIGNTTYASNIGRTLNMLYIAIAASIYVICYLKPLNRDKFNLIKRVKSRN